MPYQIEFALSLECLNKDELLERINKNVHSIIVDTIGKYQGNRFRIKGAKTIPYPEVINRREELLLFDEIIKKVALGLKLLNIPNVKVYEGGIDEWLENKLPVEEA
jgi:3-mercaptopyruvate sulfurtransferase SseA